jgi:chromatin remodeling complex protein RSC6
MVRVSSKAEKQTTPAVAAPAPENVVEKVTKPRVSKKAPVATSSEETAAAPASTEPAAAAAVETLDAESTASARITEFSAKLQQIGNMFTSMKADFKNLEKAVARELKNAQKSSSKRRKVSTGNRAPSGFVKPTRISDELAAFLGKSAGVEMARTAVSKEINAYIREKSLQDPANGRKINPDVSLTKLLNLKTTDELTYFNLQRYMKHHFIKAVPPAVTA